MSSYYTLWPAEFHSHHTSESVARLEENGYFSILACTQRQISTRASKSASDTVNKAMFRKTFHRWSISVTAVTEGTNIQNPIPQGCYSMWYNDSNYLLRKSWKRRRMGKLALRTFTVSSIPEYRSWFSTTSGLKRFGAYTVIQVQKQIKGETEEVFIWCYFADSTVTASLNTDRHSLYIHFSVESQLRIYGHGRWKGRSLDQKESNLTAMNGAENGADERGLGRS